MFSKANPEKAAEVLSHTRETKKYKAPKRKKVRKKPGRKPGPPKPPLKPGSLTQAEHAAVDALVMSSEPGETEEQFQERTKALSLALRKSTAAIKSAVPKARERLQERALSYADLHFEAAQIAAMKGDASPAQWALERIKDKDEKGKTQHIVAPVKSEDNGPRLPTVNIGVMLGGIAPNASLAKPTFTVETIDAEDET